MTTETSKRHDKVLRFLGCDRAQLADDETLYYDDARSGVAVYAADITDPGQRRWL